MNEIDFDILDIDYMIRKKYEDEFNMITIYKERLEVINKILDIDLDENLKKRIKKTKYEITEKIYDLEIKKKYNFYLFEILPIIEKYKECLKKPIKISFIGKNTITDETKNLLIKK